MSNNPENLTKREHAYLAALHAAAPGYVSRLQFAKLCQPPENSEYSYGSNLVDVHIKNLRKKLAGTKWSVVTMHRKGYRLEHIA